MRIQRPQLAIQCYILIVDQNLFEGGSKNYLPRCIARSCSLELLRYRGSPQPIMGGGGGGRPTPLTQKINLKTELNFCVYRVRGRTTSLFLHQKCFNVNSSGHKEPQNCDFQPPHAC